MGRLGSPRAIWSQRMQCEIWGCDWRQNYKRQEYGLTLLGSWSTEGVVKTWILRQILPTEYEFYCPLPCNHALYVCVCTEHKCYYLGLLGTSWVGPRCVKKGMAERRTAEDTTGPRRWESCYQRRTTAAGEQWRAEGEGWHGRHGAEGEGLWDGARWGGHQMGTLALE